ncbi:MAG: peptidoglycan editing factor PgeF [Actinomycetes bacterium]
MFQRTGMLGRARFAVTNRDGGSSARPYDTLNLGDHVGDDPAAVEQNRRRVAAAVGFGPADLVLMRQVHGRDVAVVDGPPGPGDDAPEADALVTTRRGLVLTVLVADCTPVLLASPHADVVGVVHAGRRGLAAGVVPAAVDAMRTLGARPSGVVAHIGPGVCGRCYEVSPTVQSEVAAAVPAALSATRDHRPSLDIPAGVVAQLAKAGVVTVQSDHCCTAERVDLYSYRRDGVTGRFAGLAWLPA